MIVLGVTGSLASGKSSVAAFLKKCGAKVFDADVAAKQVIRKGRPLHTAVLKLFGERFLARDGQIDRHKLAEHVFSDPKELKKLNTLIHPPVILEAIAFIKKFKNRKGVVVLDAPLLFEARMERLADEVLVVRSPKSAIYGRTARRGTSKTLANKILLTQWPIERKARLADHVIENGGTLKDLERETKKIYQSVLEKSSK